MDDDSPKHHMPQSQSIEDQLSLYLALYASARGAGHTLAAVTGAVGTGAYVVCATGDHAESLKREYKVNTLSIKGDLDRFRGFRRALIWDNYALTEVFGAARSRIEALKFTVAQLDQERIRLESERDLLAREVERLKLAGEPLWRRAVRFMRRRFAGKRS